MAERGATCRASRRLSQWRHGYERATVLDAIDIDRAQLHDVSHALLALITAGARQRSARRAPRFPQVPESKVSMCYERPSGHRPPLRSPEYCFGHWLPSLRKAGLGERHMPFVHVIDVGQVRILGIPAGSVIGDHGQNDTLQSYRGCC